MPRALRMLIPGGIYHVTSRGNELRTIFRDDVDRQRFLDTLGHVAEEMGWRVLAYCLMDNHFHVLVLTPEANLAKGMHRLNGTYAQWFNLRHERVGHLFQGRYGAKLVRSDPQLRATVRYIAWNPVRAALCGHPCDWRWSSHNATLGRARRPPFLAVGTLLALLGTPEGRLDAYRRLCAPDKSGRLDRMSLHQLALTFLLDGRRDIAAMAEAHASGFTMAQIAFHLGIDKSTVSRRLLRERGARATVGA